MGAVLPTVVKPHASRAQGCEGGIAFENPLYRPVRQYISGQWQSEVTFGLKPPWRASQ
jgi:hypothetical protein